MSPMVLVRRWTPLAATLAIVAREATHGFHAAAPQTLALCAIPAAVACACRWCRRRKQRKRDGPTSGGVMRRMAGIHVTACGHRLQEGDRDSAWDAWEELVTCPDCKAMAKRPTGERGGHDAQEAAAHG